MLGFVRYICKGHLISSALLALLVFFPFSLQASPDKFIEDLYTEIKVINMMRIAPGMQAEKIEDVIVKNVEFNVISKFVLGRNAISQEDFANFKSAYQNYLGNKYSKLLLGYRENLKILGVESSGKNRFLVNTVAKLGEKKMKISYLIVSANDRYKIIDIILADGVSLVITDRNEFQSFLESKSTKDLILKLNSAS